VGRSTFYAHFETKDELLASRIEDVFEILNKHFTDSDEHSGNQERFIPVADFFEHIRENMRLVRGVMSVESADLLFNQIQSYWNRKIEKHLASHLPEGHEPGIPLVILANHITSTMIELMKWWMNHNTPYTPQQMDQYFQKLIHPCVLEAMSAKK
jgi:AcrR family transcriptional regulator